MPRGVHAAEGASGSGDDSAASHDDHAAEDDSGEDSLSTYELERLRLIDDNKRVLAALGIDVNHVTAPAPTERPRPRRRPAEPEPCGGIMQTDVGVQPPRRSARLKQRDEDSTGEPKLDGKQTKYVYQLASVRNPLAPVKRSGAASPISQRSTRALRISTERVATYFGNVVPPQGGQIKKSVMDMAVADGGAVTFSRMSGIQEWTNAIFLFVNVYGTEYKNVFLDNGKQITWFAQNKSSEATPVIQELIANKNPAASKVYLFCRLQGEGYVACGRLGYLAHDPSRVPIRFVFRLVDYQVVNKSPQFTRLKDACAALFA